MLGSISYPWFWVLKSLAVKDYVIMCSLFFISMFLPIDYCVKTGQLASVLCNPRECHTKLSAARTNTLDDTVGGPCPHDNQDICFFLVICCPLGWSTEEGVEQDFQMSGYLPYLQKAL